MTTINPKIEAILRYIKASNNEDIIKKLEGTLVSFVRIELNQPNIDWTDSGAAKNIIL